ncbi:MAG: hypothetical protein M3441_01790 [Chloroflexota bacterium]|nr:hypothetical protein [Chloroflexota bacterium]
MPERIKLSEVLANLSQEIITAEENARLRGRAVMQFEECEVEFGVEIEKQGNASINIWVIDLGGGGSRSETNIIRVKYKHLPGSPAQANQGTFEEAGPDLRRQNPSTP